MNSPEPPADISFTSTVRAESLVFHSRPEVRVEFTGTAEDESASERSGFPKPVEPEVTYHDVRIDYRLRATAREEDAAPADRADGPGTPSSDS